MAPATTDRDRWLALGLLVAALALAYFVLLHPWWTVPMMDTEDRIAGCRRANCACARSSRRRPPSNAASCRCAQALRGRPGFLPEATPELATAGLVQRLEAVVAQASPGNRSCAITNRSPLSDQRPAERFVRVTVQVRLRCGTAELASVLHALESGSPRVFVENLNILAQRYFYMPGQGKAQSGGLDVSFDLYGYIAPRAPGAPRVRRARAAASRSPSRSRKTHRNRCREARMRLSDAGPRTWLLATVAGWALLAWVLALVGMGGRIGKLPDDRVAVARVAGRAEGATRAHRPHRAIRRNRAASALLRRPPPATVLAAAAGRRKRGAAVRIRAHQRADHAAGADGDHHAHQRRPADPHEAGRSAGRSAGLAPGVDRTARGHLRRPAGREAHGTAHLRRQGRRSPTHPRAAARNQHGCPADAAAGRAAARCRHRPPRPTRTRCRSKPVRRSRTPR